MNIERLKQLRDHIAALPEERFDYSAFFMDDTSNRAFRFNGSYPCNTTGCVAGHCCALFDLHRLSEPQDAHITAAAYLELDDERNEVDFLFFDNSGTANRKAAVSRLDWLLSGGEIAAYDMESEPERCGYEADE